MNQEVAITPPPGHEELQDGQGDGEEDRVGVLNVTVPLASSTRHGDDGNFNFNSEIYLSSDGHVTESKPLTGTPTSSSAT